MTIAILRSDCFALMQHLGVYSVMSKEEREWFIERVNTLLENDGMTLRDFVFSLTACRDMRIAINVTYITQASRKKGKQKKFCGYVVGVSRVLMHICADDSILP